MGRPRLPIDPVADLKARLADLPEARLRAAVGQWWADHGFADYPPNVNKRIALALIEQPLAIHKRAGIAVLHMLAPQLRAADLPAFARVFQAGYLADLDLVDRFAAVLRGLLARVPGAARALVPWRLAETCWQRRAACLAVLELARRGEAVDAILAITGTIIWSPELEDQTAVGCVLRELWIAQPARAEAWFRRHARLMTRPCARLAVARLAPALRTELLAVHRRATSIRR